MDWTRLFSMQKKLDRYIEKNHHLLNENLFEDRYLALLVELGELANETRCFKFWSTKSTMDEQAVLEEYVDGIHFILSIGLDQGYDKNLMLTEVNVPSRSVTEQFNQVFHSCTVFKNESTKQNYLLMFEDYLKLGHMLGITYEKIEQAYVAKNEINFARQDEGY